jgi:hypothetical protein
MPKAYQGIRTAGGSASVFVVEDQPGSGTLSIPLRHVVKHSPDGFEWGYTGSGPAELARCILIDALGAEAKCRTCSCTRCDGLGAEHYMSDNGYCMTHGADWPDCKGEREPVCFQCGGSGRQGPCWDCGGTGIGQIVERNYRAFKLAVIANLSRGRGWMTTEEQVLSFLALRTKVET